MERSDECFDGCFQLPELNCVRGSEFLELRDLRSEPLLVVRGLAAYADLGDGLVRSVQAQGCFQIPFVVGELRCAGGAFGRAGDILVRRS